ncbi:ATP-binding protein [uncultured Treponema sp.]|uniref:ATP-binding protein n=1 Tax=uncultured Treponema sp. TaxID=162155 RepID=UPI0025D8F914|nr:ATP-binding protein [uncultured Treponema sp.]
MNEINREFYLNKLMSSRHNGMIKVITGLRRSGKSYLLFNLFVDALKKDGIDENHIIQINLEDRHNKFLRNPDELLSYIDSKITDEKMHYILLDEVQLVNEFEDVLNSYLRVSNADVFVTGSNARFLSKDVITEFRGRGYEIHIHPLSFKEFYSANQHKTPTEALRDYMTYGGLPKIAAENDNEIRREYLKNLFTNTYLIDIKERYSIHKDDDLDELISVLSSSVGSLINPRKLADTFRSVKKSGISQDTIKNYLDYMQDAFLIEKSVRYDIKGKKYIDTPAKYYFEDLGLRNARLNFRQTEETHLMENLIYNELRIRGFSVDVGQVTLNTKNNEGRSERKNLEVDFVCNKGYERVYIQSAFSLADDSKKEQEFRSLMNIKDGFEKVVISGGIQPTYRTENGILVLNLFDFLLETHSF